jgi:steroid delta-isomerase-like uncharacterized protein
MPMAKAQEVANRWVEAFNAHDADGLRFVSTDDAVLEAPGDIRLEGRDAVVDYALNWLDAFPDGEMAIDHVIAADGWIVQQFAFEGTQSDTLAGPMGDIPPTNRHLVGRGAQFMRIEGDRIAETHLYFDQLQVLTQLGRVAELAGGSR